MTLLDPCPMDKWGFFFLPQKENLLVPYDRIGLSSIPCLALNSSFFFWFLTFAFRLCIIIISIIIIIIIIFNLI